MPTCERGSSPASEGLQPTEARTLASRLTGHLGQNEVLALPTSRGFNTSFGYWTGAEDHYNKQAPQAGGHFDFADNLCAC